jgi:hypothetical protein
MPQPTGLPAGCTSRGNRLGTRHTTSPNGLRARKANSRCSAIQDRSSPERLQHQRTAEGQQAGNDHTIAHLARHRRSGCHAYYARHPEYSDIVVGENRQEKTVI